jgi:hypothetical protein
MEKRADTLVFLDGDQKKGEMRDPDSVPPSEEDQLGEMIRQATGMELPMIVDGGAGGGNTVQKIEFEKNFMRWYRQHVRFLPSTNPEMYIWEATPLTDEKQPFTSPDFKQRFADLTKARLGFNESEAVDGKQILVFEMAMLADVPRNHAGIAEVREEIRKHVQGLPEQ